MWQYKNPLKKETFEEIDISMRFDGAPEKSINVSMWPNTDKLE